MRRSFPFALLALLLAAPLAGAVPLTTTGWTGVYSWTGVATQGSADHTDDFLVGGTACLRGEADGFITLRVPAGPEDDVVRLRAGDSVIDVLPGSEGTMRVHVSLCLQFVVEGLHVTHALPYVVTFDWA